MANRESSFFSVGLIQRRRLTRAQLQAWTENLTGTRGAYRTYNTVAPKIKAWTPTVASRGGN